jgi:hypothetical protein
MTGATQRVGVAVVTGLLVAGGAVTLAVRGSGTAYDAAGGTGSGRPGQSGVSPNSSPGSTWSDAIQSGPVPPTPPVGANPPQTANQGTTPSGTSGSIGGAPPAGVASAPGGSPAGTSGGGSTGRCFTGAWPNVTSGRPVRDGDPAGVYLSSQANTIMLTVTHFGHERSDFTGSVTTDGTFVIAPVRLEHGDTWRISPDGHTLSFSFANFGYTDGLAITPVCGAYVTVRANLGQQPSPLRQVKIDGVAYRSLATPLTITRTS